MASASGAAVSKMADFFGSCTPEQIGELMQVLQATKEKNASGSAPNATSTMASKAGVIAKRSGKKQRNKQAKIEQAKNGPKRPLNSWMAFRNYYNGSLAPNTQKTISKVLTKMWRADPFEAKWAMIAKAYSVVRGSREKEDAPLDEFLSLCAPIIGVIPPHDYQTVMGWQLTPASLDDKDKTPNLIRVFVPTFPAELKTTTLSVDDLIQRCYAAGYTKDDGEETVTRNTSGYLTMAVQPTNTTTETNTGSSVSATTVQAMLPPLSPATSAFENTLRTALEGASEGATTLAHATVNLNNLCSELTGTKAFHPTSQLDISFNPNHGADAWDAQDMMATIDEFEMSDFVNLD